MQPFLLNAILALTTTPKVVTIDGPAGSGKTFLADELASAIRKRSLTVEVIHMDDLYNGWDDALTATLSETLIDIIRQSSSPEIAYRAFDWNLNTFSDVKSISTPDVLILEGVGSGQSAIRSSVSLSIWIEVSPELGLKRVLERDGDSVAPFMDQWQFNQNSHFLHENTKGASDYCLDGAPSASL